MKTEGLKRNIGWSLLLTAANCLFPLLVYMHVSRVLGVASVGLVGFVDGVTTYFILFSMMGVSSLGVRLVARSRGDRRLLADRFWALLSLHAGFTLLVLLLMVAATFCIQDLRANRNLMEIGMCKLVLNVFLVEWLFMGLEDFRFITLRTLAVKASYVVAVFMMVRTRSDLFTYYVLTMLVVAAIAVINMLTARRELGRPSEGFLREMSQMIRPFFSLGIYEIVTSALMTFCMVFLGFASTDVEVGLFTTATKMIVLVTALFVACLQVVGSRTNSLMGRHHADGLHLVVKRNTDKTLAYTFALGVAMGGMLYVAAPWAVLFLSGPEYGGAVWPLRLLACSLPVMVLGKGVTMLVLVPRECDRTVAWNSAAGFAACAAACVLLAPRFGASGAAIAWIAAELLTCTLNLAAIMTCKCA